MLKSLYIKNYAIIDELNIDFNSGFNVFTGETGAGKSIIVGALSYLIRGKADASIIKTGQNKAIIEGVFTIDDYMKKSLDEAEIGYDDELIIRRIISNDGHNSIKVNQVSVTLNFLIELLGEHIDIHSQKDSQYLLNKKNHLILLDKYCKNESLLDEYKDKYQIYIKALKEYEDLKNNTYNEAELDYYKYDLKELEDSNLDLDEEDELRNAEKKYKSAEKYISCLSNSISLYDGDSGIKEKLSILLKQLNIDDDEINKIKENIENIYYNLDDQISSLKHILNSFTNEDFDIEKIEERLYLYSRLQRKHKTDTQGLINKRDELKQKIAFFENKDFVLNEKKKQLDAYYNDCYLLASKIHKNRVDEALKLEKDIVSNTSDLMLNNVVFKVKIDEVELNNKGIDNVEFFISLNKGESLKPLKDVASGGEISRLMLALKTIFTSLADTSLIIFDEIDTGVSGKVGLAIGQKMANIARNTQVISITHLAPVAACAKNHYYIYKVDNNGVTSTAVKQLNHDEIINELAFISSADNSDKSLEAAKQLYKTAQESIKDEN